MTPNIENIRTWVAALRSGEYEQTKHMLHDGVGFCCLGVACDLWAKATEASEPWKPGTQATTYQFIDESDPHRFAVGFPPRSVRQWLGLDDSEGLFGRLADMNDAGKPFSAIADLIEATYLQGEAA